MVKPNVRKRSDGVTIECRVTPRASRNAIKGVREGVLDVSLCSPPVEGRANKALAEFLSKLLGVRKSAISIVGGERSRNKVVLIEGLSEDDVKRMLSDV
jgi:uncharacterized protein (TIGR00251 family)